MKTAAGLPRIALPLLIFAAAGCASSGPREAPPQQPPIPRSAATPAELLQVDTIREVIEGQLRTLEGEQSEAMPDCARIRLLSRNICTLAEHICSIASRYPKDDPIADSCGDARARCRRADETVKTRCTLTPE